MASQPEHTLDVPTARSHFPSLASGFIFADNAGGSQASTESITRITDYLSHTNVQLGAVYSISQLSTQRVYHDGPRDAARLFNAASRDEVVFGPSSTMNLENLARGLEGDVSEGDEFVVTGEHEANAGPWKKLAARKGASIKLWEASHIPSNPASNPYAIHHSLTDLLPLITARTRLVAFSACSNILGSVVPVKEVVRAVREEARKKGARKLEISVDCVAYAPHRRIDVRDWDVDYCVFSFYKVYGAHISALYVRQSSLQTSITPIIHHFLASSPLASTSYKLQPGGPGYELVYSTTGVAAYLTSLTPLGSLDAAFAAIAVHEQRLLEVLLGFLTSVERRERGVYVVGDERVGIGRVPTVSFVVRGERPLRSRDIVDVFDKKGGIGIRYGHFYAYTLIDTLSPRLDDVEDGVVRISLVHYNTVEEVRRIVEVLEEVLA